MYSDSAFGQASRRPGYSGEKNRALFRVDSTTNDGDMLTSMLVFNTVGGHFRSVADERCFRVLLPLITRRTKHQSLQHFPATTREPQAPSPASGRKLFLTDRGPFSSIGIEALRVAH